MKTQTPIKHQPFFSQRGFELKKWICNNDEVSAGIPQDLKSTSHTQQVEMESNTEGYLVLGLQSTVTDDSLQVCRGTNREVERALTKRRIQSQGVFAPFCVHMTQLLKGN